LARIRVDRRQIRPLVCVAPTAGQAEIAGIVRPVVLSSDDMLDVKRVKRHERL
jgi:hypothetical protein